MDWRSTGHPGYRQSLNAGRGRGKYLAGSSRRPAWECKHRGGSTVGGVFLLHVIAWDMIRLANMLKAKVAIA